MQDSFVSERVGLAIALVLILTVAPAGAADVRWQERDGDRYEGIRAENIGGGDFKLLGVQVEPSPHTPGASHVYLSIPLSEEAELHIRVWEPESGYTMVPLRKRFRPGDRFSWRRAAVLGPEGLEAEQLFVLATNSPETLYYPARLTTSAPPSEVKGYVFRFHSGGGVGLDVTIARQDEGRLLEISRQRREERYGGLLDFEWDGRDAHGALTPAGTYHLQLKGTVFLKSPRSIHVDVPFVHHGEIAP